MKSGRTRNLKQYSEIYTSGKRYGEGSWRMADGIHVIIDALVRFEGLDRKFTVLDFGCGRSPLIETLDEKIQKTHPNHQISFFRYDPAILDFSICPVDECDMVINTDVLEHLDENEISLILEDIRGIAPRAFFAISTRPASTQLPSGENAHATVKEGDWWMARINEYFPHVSKISQEQDSILILATAKKVIDTEKIAADFRAAIVRSKPFHKRLGIKLKQLLQ